jgi:hypothetical protein
MKRTLILILAASACAFAQDGVKTVFYQNVRTGGVVSWGSQKASDTPVQSAPYSATITNESIQTLADGNRIVQSSTGTIARDSQGRTRRDIALPSIGNLSATNAPHLVFIQDPVAQVSYTLNLTDKTGQKIAMPPVRVGDPGAPGGTGAFFIQLGVGVATAGQAPLPDVSIQKGAPPEGQAEVSKEDLGSRTMQGILVNGVRTIRTIPAGQIGNEKPIRIVTEVWTSPDLKAIVYSKRSDPRIGEQTFQLTNLVLGEPDPSLFSVPADFRIMDGPQDIIYRRGP